MWQSTTLPRVRPADPPPPPPLHKSTTLYRKHRGSANFDVQQLRFDIDVLSQQLMMVKAQLESTMAAQEEVEVVLPTKFVSASTTNLSRDNSVDSRLSTVLFSPSSSTSARHTPTPKPTHITIPIVMESRPSTPSTNAKKPPSLSSSHFAHLAASERPRQEKRMSFCGPSSSSLATLPKRRETFTKVDEPPKAKTALRVTKVKRAESLTNQLAGLGGPPRPPPKPRRTFQQGLPNQRSDRKTDKNQSSYTSSSIALLSMCNHEEFLEAIKERFKQGQCWFSRGGQLYFVNPFNDISSRHVTYSVIPTVTSSLFEAKHSALILRGISGSGKSQLAEMVCLDVVDRMDPQGNISAIFYAALIAIRPFLSTNNSQNNQTSKAVLHYELQVRDGRISRVVFRHFLIDSPSRGCRANIFAMFANDLSEPEKEKYRIAGFRLRDSCSDYGSLDEVSAALSTLDLSVSDIFKVLAACILLNNLQFRRVKNAIDIENLSDLEDASSLLGVSALSMYKALMAGTSEGKFAIDECQNMRDSFVSAIYSRTVEHMLRKINNALDSLSESSEQGSLFTDSGISIGNVSTELHTIHVVDVPGYVRSSNNSLAELLVNSVNDVLQATNRDATSMLLQDIESSNKSGEGSPTWQRENVTIIPHADEQFEVQYDMRRLSRRNLNTISKELINLFDSRTCSSVFAVKIFCEDVEKLIVDKHFEPRAIDWPLRGRTVIQNVLQNMKKLQSDIADNSIQQIICLKSNDSLEYARLQEFTLTAQLELYRLVIANNSCFASAFRRNSLGELLPTSEAVRPSLPSPRRYEVRDRRKHCFPQRRKIVTDFQDPTSGVLLRAGDVVKAIEFSGECYAVETGRKTRATVPTSFTEKTVAPPDPSSI